MLQRSEKIEGLTFSQLASFLKLQIPPDPKTRKGWVGQAVEYALGVTAKNQALPDFNELGIELKTLPVNHLGKPQESTFITSISLLKVFQETWETSLCYGKLRRVLWIPIEGDKSISFAKRRIGRAILWSPDTEQVRVLRNDWQLLTNLIVTGKLHELSASMGQYLQIRPKCANSKSLCHAFNEDGRKVLTLPRGFYLRSSFTNLILNNTH